MKTTEEHATKLREIADYAFAYGSDSIGLEHFKQSPNEWPEELKKKFIIKCHDGFKIAQKLLVEELMHYQQLHKGNKILTTEYRAKHDKEHVKNCIHKEKTIVQRMHCFSHIADGIAWHLLHTEIHVARRFHIGQNSAKQLQHSNIEHAIRKADEINKDPMAFALISDLTSFIQIGDLLIRRNKHVGIMELKEGKVNEQIKEFFDALKDDPVAATETFKGKFNKNTLDQMDRMLRQELRAINALEVINHDKGIDPRTGKDIAINTPTKPIKSYHEDLFKLYMELKTKDFAYTVVEDCVHIGMYKGESRMMGTFAVPQLIKVHTDNYVFIDWLSITKNLSAPLFAKPFDRGFIIEVMTGSVKVFIGINMDRLIEVFNDNGLVTRWLTKKETARAKQKYSEHHLVIVNHRGIALTYPGSQQAVMSGGILSKILYDSNLPSSLAAGIASAALNSFENKLNK